MGEVVIFNGVNLQFRSQPRFWGNIESNIELDTSVVHTHNLPLQTRFCKILNSVQGHVHKSSGLDSDVGLGFKSSLLHAIRGKIPTGSLQAPRPALQECF
jgi:hypothetical protein